MIVTVFAIVAIVLAHVAVAWIWYGIGKERGITLGIARGILEERNRPAQQTLVDGLWGHTPGGIWEPGEDSSFLPSLTLRWQSIDAVNDVITPYVIRIPNTQPEV